MEVTTQEQIGERFRLAAHATGFGVWEWFPHEDKVLWDDKLHQIYELDPNDNLDKTTYFYGIVHPKDKPFIDAQMKELLSHPLDNQYFEQVCRIQAPSGQTKFIRTYGEVIANGNKVQSIVGISRDITEQEKLKAELMLSQEQLEMVCENLNDLVVLLRLDESERDLEIRFVNSSFMQLQRVLGLEASKKQIQGMLLGNYFREIVKFPESEIKVRMDRVMRVLETGKSVRFLEESSHIGEIPLILESIDKPIFRRDGEKYVLWISRDISAQVNARRNSESLQSRFNLLLQQSSAVAISFDTEHAPSFVSPKVSELLGYEDVVLVKGGSDLWNTLLVEDFHDEFHNALSDLFERRIPVDINFSMFHSTGNSIPLNFKANTYRDEKDEVQVFGLLTRTD